MAEVIAPTAPSTPAASTPASSTPAPSTPSAPPSTPNKPESHDSAPDNVWADKFEAMDKRILSRRPKTPEPAPAKPAEPPAKPATPEPAAAAPETKPTQAQPPKPVSAPAALRGELDRVKRDYQASQTELTTLRQKIAEYEKNGTNAGKLAEDSARWKKEAEEHKATIRMLKREKSPEFIANFEKPFNESAKAAESDINQLWIEEVKNGEGETVEQARAAKWDDFVALYQMPLGKAVQMAHKLFGPASQIVVSHLTELKRMEARRNSALAEEQKAYETRFKDEQANDLKFQEFVAENWQKVNNDIAARNPEWFGMDPKDEEGNKLFTEALSIIDAGLQGSLTPQQKIVHDAQLRLRAAAAPRLAHRLDRAQERIAELEQALAQAKGSKPGDTRRPTTATTSPTQSSDMKPWKSDLREHMAQG